MYLVALGRFDEAISEGRKAVELDPLPVNSLARLGQILSYARRYDDAIRELRNALELDTKPQLGPQMEEGLAGLKSLAESIEEPAPPAVEEAPTETQPST